MINYIGTDERPGSMEPDKLQQLKDYLKGIREQRSARITRINDLFDEINRRENERRQAEAEKEFNNMIDEAARYLSAGSGSDDEYTRSLKMLLKALRKE